MKHPVRLLDKITRVCPLGVRFWDEVMDTTVSSGLVVTCYPKQQPRRRVRATVNYSGVFVFQNLPGLREVENGAGDVAFWASLTQRHDFVVEVEDLVERFLAMRFPAQLPVRGLFALPAEPGASPPGPVVPLVPLYSSPVRLVPAGMAVVRATLWDPDAGAPAAWAVLAVRRSGQRVGHGIADDQGRVAVLFPYPEPAVASGSPPAGLQMAEQSWLLEIQANYERTSPPQPVPDLPDLSATLRQRAATLWANTARTQPLPSPTLQFGQELVLSSQRAGPADPDPQSRLWITSTG